MSKIHKLTWSTLLAIGVLLAAGCASPFHGVVTLTETVDSASREYAKAYNDGLVSQAVDERVTMAHANYQVASMLAASALTSYKLSGDPAQYQAAFESARAAAVQFINIIAPLLSDPKASKIKTQLAKANVL